MTYSREIVAENPSAVMHPVSSTKRPRHMPGTLPQFRDAGWLHPRLGRTTGCSGSLFD